MGNINPGPTTSASLLLRIRNSTDTESWLLFESVYAPLIRAYCRRRGFQSADIDDVTQEVLSKVAEKIRDFDYQPQLGKFRSWLAAVTANQLKSFLRKRAIHDEHLVAAVETFSRSPKSDSDWSTLFAQKVFDAACKQIRPDFTEQTWRCFEETWVNHCSPADVAELLGIPIHSVYVNKSRVLQKLEQQFQILAHDLPIVD